MNALPEPLRQVGRDLVEKKLWPIAVLLLAAIVAVPLLIGSSSGDPGTPPAPVAASAPGGAGSESLITVVDQAVTGKERPGDVRDPIYDPPEPQDAAPATAAGGTAASAPAAPAAGGSTGGGATATPKPVTPATTGAPPQSGPAPVVAPAADGVHYRTVVRWYAGEAGKARPISRLTPLGDRAEPAVLYLGVTRSQARYAVFLLGSHATSKGDGKCEDADCRLIGLKTGDRQTVAYQLASGEVRRYHLELVSVKSVAADGADARRMRARVHPDGREVMRAMWQDERTAAALGRVRYDVDRGLLYKTRAAEKGSQ